MQHHVQVLGSRSIFATILRQAASNWGSRPGLALSLATTMNCIFPSIPRFSTASRRTRKSIWSTNHPRRGRCKSSCTPHRTRRPSATADSTSPPRQSTSQQRLTKNVETPYTRSQGDKLADVSRIAAVSQCRNSSPPFLKKGRNFQQSPREGVGGVGVDRSRNRVGPFGAPQKWLLKKCQLLADD